MPQIIKAKARIFHHPEHGKRLIFIDGPTNPRDKLGKIGIDLHNAFTHGFRDSIAAKVTVINDDGDESVETVYFNRSSLIKYLLTIPHIQIFYINNDAEAKKFFDGMITANPSYTLLDFFTDYIASDDDALVKAVDIAMLAVKDEQAKHKWQQVYHAGQVSDVAFSSNTDATDNVTGKFYSWQYQQTIGSLASIKTRFAFINKERDAKFVSESMARLRFKEASQDTPAYRDFLASRGAVVKRFADIPATSKKSYIVPSQTKHRDVDTHKHGKYPKKFKMDTSTGTTGKPTVWVRGHDEIITVKKSFNTAREVEFGKRKLFYINAFALGPWATGLTAFESMRETGSTFSPGPDLEKILDALEEVYEAERIEIANKLDSYIKLSKKLDDEDLSHIRDDLLDMIYFVLDKALDDKDISITQLVFRELNKRKALRHEMIFVEDLVDFIKRLNRDKKQYFLAGYPPFLKAVADGAKAANIDFAKYHVRGVVGGQGISTAFRKSLLQAGFVKVNSSYGASDLDINIGAETDFEIALREAIDANSALAHDLYGEGKGTPMVFHYDPFNYLIEADKDDELFFTCVRTDRSSARLRYDLGDKGRVYAASDIEALLLKHGITHLKPRINLPLLFVWGRDSAVSFNGSKVAFDDLEHAITSIDKKNRFLKRAFYKYYDTQTGAEKFDILIELSDKEKMPDRTEAHAILRQLIVEMAVHNQDFRAHLGRSATTPPLPRLRIFTRGESPISDAGGVRKQVLVFDDKNMPAGYDIHAKAKASTFSIKKDEEFSSALEKALAAPAKKSDKSSPDAKAKKDLKAPGKHGLHQPLIEKADESSSSTIEMDTGRKVTL